MDERPIRFTATILRKQDDLPRYIVVKARHLSGRAGAFPARVSLDGHAPFARTIRPWGKGSDAYFFNLTGPQCRAAGLDTGDSCMVRIEPSVSDP